MTESLAINPASFNAPQDPAMLPLPQLRNDLIIYETSPDDTGQSRWHILDTSRNRYFLLGYSAYQMLLAWPFVKNIGALVRRINRVSAKKITIEDALEMLQFLQSSQLFISRTQVAVDNLLQLFARSKSSPLKKAVHSYLFFRVPVWHPDAFLTKTIKFIKVAFLPAFWIATLVLAMISVYLTSKQFDLYINYFLDFFSLEGLAIYGGFLVMAKIMHELGHAYTAKNFGCEVPTIGVAFLVMWPVLYTDGTALWKLKSKRQKLLVNLAGVIVEIWLAIVSLFLWNILPDGALKSATFVMATITITGTLLINLNIFMRFDGYYILADLLGIENLQPRAFLLAKWKLRKWIFGIEEKPPEAFSSFHHKFLIAYAIGIWIYRFFLFLGIALLVYYLFFKVLGIILFVIEIVYFIAKPIYNEVHAWWKIKDKITWNFETKRSAIILAILLLLIALPWQSHVKATAVIEREQNTVVYSPTQGMLTQINATVGQNINVGEILASMRSPSLESAIEIEKINIESTNIRLKRAASSSSALEQLQVVARERQRRLATLKALEEEKTNLNIKSTVSGKVVLINEGLKNGMWIDKNAALMQIVSTDNNKIIAYVEEEHIERITTQAKAIFFPEVASFPPQKIKVSRIDKSPIRALEREELASNYGGEISIRNDGKGQLAPTKTLYRVILTPDSLSSVPLLLRGRVFIEAERRSPISKFFKLFASVVIRESGF